MCVCFCVCACSSVRRASVPQSLHRDPQCPHGRLPHSWCSGTRGMPLPPHRSLPRDRLADTCTIVCIDVHVGLPSRHYSRKRVSPGVSCDAEHDGRQDYPPKGEQCSRHQEVPVPARKCSPSKQIGLAVEDIYYACVFCIKTSILFTYLRFGMSPCHLRRPRRRARSI